MRYQQAFPGHPGGRVNPGTTGMPEQLLVADPEAFRLGCQ